MSYNRDVINEEQVASYLSDALKRLGNASDSDIQAYETLKKVFKKNVPFTRRNYVAAMLLKQALNGYKGNRFSNDRSDRFNRNERNDRSERNERRNERAERANRKEFERAERPAAVAEERTERAPRVQIDPAMATTIFIGIGRNRRVYPRDLVGLLVSVAGLERDRIGDIRVLANYSFIQLFTEDCEKAIAALNGYDYRGRKLSVSYSKQREDGEDVAEAAVEAADVSAPAFDEGINIDPIPANVTNVSSGSIAVASEEDKIAAEQSAFAASVVNQKPYAETTDDGQVKSHFGDGAAY